MAEIAFETASALKEVYLISKFIAKTARSARHHDQERAELEEELDLEHLYIRSFGLFFFQNEGTLVPNEGLNQEWLKKLSWMLDNLRLAFGDYAKLAAEGDADYQIHSPYLNTSTQPALLDFAAFNDAINASSDDTVSFATITRIDTTILAPSSDAESKKSHRFPTLRGWKWALFEKKKLEAILATSQKWTKRMRELSQLTMSVNPRYTSQLLESPAGNNTAHVLGLAPHVRLRQLNLDPPSLPPPEDIDLEGLTLELPAKHGDLTLAKLVTSPQEASYVLVEMKELEDTTHESPENKERIMKENKERILQLANLLASSGNSDLATLPLRGYLPLPNAFAFAFRFPEGAVESPPESLYDLVSRPLAASPGLSLPYRFHVAQSIAKSLSALHADDWVHKSFRSRSIVFFKDGTSRTRFDKPYLVNFEYARAFSSATPWSYDEDEEKNLYRHPDRQRPPQKSFNQIHDLYALGIVLLEVGLWQNISATKRDILSVLPTGTNLDPETLSACFLKLAKEKLPHTMGPAYAEAVETCLLGTFGVAVEDPTFALQVYELVVQKLDIQQLQID
jgi:hypothetical protein